MKTVQQIEEEYKDFQPTSTYVTNLDEFLTFMEIGLDDTDEYQKDYEKDLKENKRWALEARVRNLLFFIFQEEDVDLYAEDDKILHSCIDYLELLRKFYQRIQGMATEDNFRELVKLVDFSDVYYSSQMDYYDFLRDRLEMLARGYNLYNSRYEDTKEPYTEFMNKKLAEIKKNTPPKEKPKVMEKIAQ